MEFLGLLMCNVPSMRCIGLTESRETKLLGMIAEWMGRRPAAGRAPLLVTPVEMARLLGHLVFASQVVQGGRVAMQAMLSSFKGMVVDWRSVALGPGAANGGRRVWRNLKVEEGFWPRVVGVAPRGERLRADGGAAARRGGGGGNRRERPDQVTAT